MNEKSTSVLVAEDHALVRELLCTRLAAEAGISVVAVVGCGEDAVRQFVRYRPDIVLLDIEMPGLSSFEAAQTIRTLDRRAKVIFVTAFVNDHYIQKALDLEGSGYVTKSEHPDTIIEAIHAVRRGSVYFSPEVQDRICVDGNGVHLRSSDRTRYSLLTRREQTVLRCVARGLSNKEIGNELCISPKTVEHHCSHIMTKLDIHDRVKLARYAIREGMTLA